MEGGIGPKEFVRDFYWTAVELQKEGIVQCLLESTIEGGNE